MPAVQLLMIARELIAFNSEVATIITRADIKIHFSLESKYKIMRKQYLRRLQRTYVSI